MAAPVTIIPYEELKIEVYDPQGSHGMRVATTLHGVQVTHLPSGTVARYHESRTQHTNRAVALEMIEAALTHPRHRP